MARYRLRAFPRTLARSWPGRLLLAGAAVKILLFPFVTNSESLLAWLDVGASLALAAGMGYLLVRSVARLRRRLLWRVRRKLILSYVFIGFVPVLLVVAFFAVAGAMSVLSVSSEMVRRELDGVIADARVAAAASGARLSSGMEASAALELLTTLMRPRYPGASALVTGQADGGVAATIGPWSSGSRPEVVPDWVEGRGFAGLVAVGAQGRLAIRAVARRNGRQPARSSSTCPWTARCGSVSRPPPGSIWIRSAPLRGTMPWTPPGWPRSRGWPGWCFWSPSIG